VIGICVELFGVVSIAATGFEMSPFFAFWTRLILAIGLGRSGSESDDQSAFAVHRQPGAALRGLFLPAATDQACREAAEIRKQVAISAIDVSRVFLNLRPGRSS